MKPTTRQVFDALGTGAVIRDLRTERGTCEGCGECCSRFLPLSPLDMMFLESEIRLSGGRIVHERGPYDMRCPFLDEENLCEVYGNRPGICAVYRCDLHAKGEISAWEASVRGAVMVDVCKLADSVLSKMASTAGGAVKDSPQGFSNRTGSHVAVRRQSVEPVVDAAEERG